MTFETRAKVHMAVYKRQRLGVKADGKWVRNDKAYAHILPAELKRLNLIETIRREFDVHRRDASLKYHRDFHHLTSSQALCFNLFFPCLQERSGLWPALAGALGFPGAELAAGSLEHVPDEAEGTNFDVYLALASGERVFVEVKFTETAFGASKENAKRLHKLETIHSVKLAGRVPGSSLEPKTFFRNYQLLRNIGYAGAAQRATSVLLVPRANEALGGVDQLLAELVHEAEMRWIRIAYLEDVIAALRQAEAASVREAAHVELLGEKYLIA